MELPLRMGDLWEALGTENEKNNEDIKLFNQALSDDDELIGERLRVLSRILKEMGY